MKIDVSAQLFFAGRRLCVMAVLSLVLSGLASPALHAQSLPTGWSTEDIGSPGAVGSASYSSGTFTLEGSGTDIYGTADEFRFVYQQITGDCTIIAKVDSVQQTGTYAKGGIMIRNDLTAGAENATVVVTAAAGDDVNFQERTSAGGSTTQATVSGINAPQWVKLVRAGNSFTAFYSSNGTSWTQMGTAETIGIASTAYVGLVTDSFDNGTLCTSTFSNVSVTTPDTTPPSVSMTAPTGGASVSGSSVTVSATASDNVAVRDVQFQLDGANLGTDLTTAPYSISWDSTTATNGTHSLTAIATDTSGNSTTSSAVSVTVSNSTSLPSPWMTQDVGSVGATGSASYSSGTFTLEGSGADIYGTADAFRFVYLQITGDCTIIAKVDSVEQTGTYAKGGIMIRNDLTAGAENATVVVTAAAGDDVNFQERTSAGGSTTQAAVSGINAPQWVKLVRAGNSFTAFYSSNGTSWTQVGTAETIGMASTAYVGLVTDSFDNGTLCTSTFSSVSTTDTTPPSVSMTAPTGGASVSGSSVTVSATASDNIAVGDVQFQLDGANLGTDLTTAPYSISWDSTTATNGTHSLTAIATDTSGNSTTSSAVNVTVSNSTSLPSPWMTQDVGSVGATGSAAYSSGTFTLEGSGADIYGTADAFRFVYQQITGDCTIIAKVDSVQQTGTYAKGGIMIRNDLTAGAENATVVVTAAAGDDVNFQERTSAGGSTTQAAVSGINAPQWVKLVRAGNSFTAFYSSNGTSWTQVGTAETIGMASTAYVGLVTDSFDNGTLCTSTFSNVSVTADSSYSYSQNFSSNAVGMTTLIGTWAWESATATYNATNDGSGTGLAVYGALTWNTGYTYSAVIESPQSAAGDLFGLVYNYVDANDYYWLSLNPSGTAQLWKMISGTATQVGSNASWTFPGVNSAINVGITRGTGTTTVTVNGSTIFNSVAESDSQIGAGKTGFYASGNTPTFTNVTVSGTAAAVAAYYVDSVGGSDSNNGTSPTTAWKTIAKVNSSTFSAGASVLFDCGDTWHEQLTVPSSGSAGNPIVFGAYGSGSLPLIDATVPVTSGWTSYSGNIYVASVGSAVYQVYVNGSALPVAHYPTIGYLTTTGSATNESYVIDSNHPTNNLVGADIRVLSESWSVDESVITSVSGSQINDSEASGQGYPAGSGTQYVVSNMLWMLQGAGEWFYDSGAGNLYLWMPDGSNPNGANVRASTLPYGVYASGKNYVTIQDLAINGSYGTGVWLVDVPNFTAQRLTLTNLGALRCTSIFQPQNGTGVYVSRSTPTSTDLGVISNNTITNTIHDGVEAYQMENLTVADNVISNVGQAGWSAFQPCCGIGLEVVYTCANALIEHNTISNVSDDGIMINSQNNMVKENVIQNVMDELSDGGAIYTFNTDTNGTVIDHNVCINVVNTKAFGVYLDDLSQYVTVENNTIGNMPHGTMNHDGEYNTLENNTVYGVLYDAVEIQEDTLAPAVGYTMGNVYENNIYFSNDSVPLVYLSNWFSTGAGHFAFGAYSDNTFSSLDPSQAIQTSDDTATNYYTVSSWQTAGHESGSTFVPQNGTGTSIFLVNTTSAPQTYQFSNDGVSGRTYTNLNGSSVSWPITLQAYDSLILIWSGH